MIFISQYANMAKKTGKDAPRHYLKEWRELREFTQQSLADAVGTSKSVISELESNKKGLSHKWLARLAPPLQTTPGALLDYHPDSVDLEMLDHFLAYDGDNRQSALRVLKALNKKAL